MAYQLPPEIKEQVREHMASDRHASEGELLVEALRALDHVRERQEQLRDEIQERVARAGKGTSASLDRETFKDEARRRFSNQS